MIIPRFISLEAWAASLVIDFPTDNIPFLERKEKWKEWGSFLVQETSFANNGAPRPDGFSDWEPWAQAVFYSMANF